MGTFGILVGGGPAPGINGVISAAATVALRRGAKMIGILDGFKWIMEGRTDRVLELDEVALAGIHLRGGSILHTARANPTKKAKHLETCVRTLDRLGIDRLVTVGGDDTATSAIKVAEGNLGFHKIDKIFLSTEGADIEQTIYESGGGIGATALSNGDIQRRSYPNSWGDYMCRGFEFIEEMRLPDFAEQTASRVRRVTAKAWRFEGEMDEIAATFRESGLPVGFHAAAAEVYRRIAQFKDEPDTPSLEEVLGALASGEGED